MPKTPCGNARSASTSPTRMKVSCHLPDIVDTKAVEKIMSAVVYNNYNDKLLDDVPEHEWRLLAALAKKKEQEQLRRLQARTFQKLWDAEREAREEITAQSLWEYRRFIAKKREDERLLHYFKNVQRSIDHDVKTNLLIETIRDKEQRHIMRHNFNQNRKAQEIVDKVLQYQARDMIAADRRKRQQEAEQWKRKVELEDCYKKIQDAQEKRESDLRNAATRLALDNSMRLWESSLLRQEVEVREAYRRAQHAAHAHLTSMRSESIAREKHARKKRARRMAAFTQSLRSSLLANY